MAWSEWKSVGTTGDLLWENADIASNYFTYGDIALDLTNYNGIMVIVKSNIAGYQNYMSQYIERTSSGDFDNCSNYFVTDSWQRQFMISENNLIGFMRAFRNGNTSLNNDGIFIPFKIIGFKKSLIS